MDGGSVSNDQALEVRVRDRLLTDIKVTDRVGTLGKAFLI